MKRFLSMLLAIAMLLSLTSTMVFAEEPDVGVEEPGATEGDDFDVGFGELVDPIPGATPETAIVLGRLDWAIVAMNYNETAPVEMTYTATIPYGATRYFASQSLNGFDVTVGEEKVAVSGNPMMGYTFSVTNNNAESDEVVITAKMPLGTMMNPERVDVLGYTTVSVEAGNVDGYYYVYNAPAKGTVKLYINPWSLPVNTVETTDEEGMTTTEEKPYVADIVVTQGYAQKVLSVDGVDNNGLELVLDVEAGEELIIQVVAVANGLGEAYPKAEFEWCGEFVYPAGTEQNPVVIEWTWNETETVATANITVPAGAAQYFTGYSEMILTANGTEIAMSETGVFSLTEGTYELVLTTPEGAMNNPEKIENIDGYTDTNTTKENASYYYIWTATEDGTVTLDVTAGADLKVEHVTTEVDEEWGGFITNYYNLAQSTDKEVVVDGEITYEFGWEVAENITFEVKAGDTVKIEVRGLTDFTTWTDPAVEYTLTGEFESAYTPWEVTVSGITLDMASELFISAKLALPEELRTDPGTIVKITFNGNTTELNVVEYIAANGVDSRNRFSIKQPIASPYMDKLVTISVVDADGNYANLINSGTTYEGSFDFGVQTYMDLVFAQGDNYKTTKDAIAALLTYGAAAQTYFKAKGVANISDTPCTEMLTKYGYSAVDMSGFALTDITDSLVTFGDETIGVSFKNGTPALDAAVYMTVKFESDGSCDMDAYTFTLTYFDASVGQEKTMDLAPYLDNKGRFSVDILNIAAAHFDYGYTVTVTHNESGKSFSAQYSVMAYCKMAIEAYASNPNQVNSVNLYKSMYYYNQAANALFE